MVPAIAFFLIIAGCGGGGSSSASSGGGGGGGGAGCTTLTLSWTAPTKNTNDTDYTDGAGYKLYYGTSGFGTIVTITDPATTSHVLSNLSAGTYTFAVTAYSSLGVESAPSTTYDVTC